MTFYEGFIPKTFKTSRSNRVEDRKQEIHEFYDKDELEELQRVDVVTHDGEDTFASVRSEKIKERTEVEAAARPIIPGGVITEFIEGVAESIGVKLLQKMGWRQGKGIGEAFKSAIEEAVELEWGPDASLSQEGVAEETDTFGEMLDYVDNSTQQDRVNYYEISDDSDDNQHVPSREQTKLLTHKSTTFHQGVSSFIPGFHLSTVLKEQKTFQLPVVPPGFTGRIQRLDKGDKRQTEGTGKLPVPAAEVPIDFGEEKIDRQRCCLCNKRKKLGVERFGQRLTPVTTDDRGFLLGDEKLIEVSKLETKNKAVAQLDIQGVPEADRSRVKTALNSTFVGSQETGLQVEKVVPGLRAPRPKDQIPAEETFIL